MEKAVKKTGTDFTQGKLLNKFILFAIPIILTNLLQQLFTTADAIVIGQFSGQDSLGAVTSCNPVINLAINSLVALSVGANVVIAQAIGRKKHDTVNRAVHTSILFSVIVGVAIGIIGYCLSGVLTNLLSVDDVLKAKTKLYMGVYFLGSPAVLVYNFGSAILCAKGDSKRPLYFLFVSGALNVVLNLIFVICFKMDVLGVAIATVVSQVVSAVLVVTCIARGTDSTKLDVKKLCFHKKEMLAVLATGIPNMINGALFSLSNIIIHIAVNKVSADATTGNGIASSIENFTYLAMNAVYTTTLSVVGQNYGANEFGRIKKTIGIGVITVTVVGAFMGGISYLLRSELCSLFTTDNVSVAVLDFAKLRMKYILLAYPLCGIQEVFIAGSKGFGYSMVATIISFVCACVFRVIWIYTLYAKFQTGEILFMSYPISWALLVLGQAILFTVLYKKLKKRSKANDIANPSEVGDKMIA